MEMKSLVRANLDRVLAVVLALIGGILLVVGWFGVSRTGLAAEQIPYVISCGIGGIVLIALGCTAWVSADIQDEWRRLDAIEERLQDLGYARASKAYEPSSEAAASAENGRSATRTRKPRVATELQA